MLRRDYAGCYIIPVRSALYTWLPFCIVLPSAWTPSFFPPSYAKRVKGNHSHLWPQRKTRSHAVCQSRGLFDSPLCTDSKGRDYFAIPLLNQKHFGHSTNLPMSTVQPLGIQTSTLTGKQRFSVKLLDVNFNRKQLFSYGLRTPPPNFSRDPKSILQWKQTRDRSSSHNTRVLVLQLVAVLVHMEVHESLGTNFHKLW